MTTVLPINMAILHGDAQHFRKQQSWAGGSDTGLSDSFDGASPRSLAASVPESFVVTPEGEALPGIHELHVDASGSLHIVDRVPKKIHLKEVRHPKMPSKPRMWQFRPGQKVEYPLSIAWEAQPRLKWHDLEEEPTPHHQRTVQVFHVAEDGTTHVREIPLKEYQRRYNKEATNMTYVVEENGVVHHAHAVFIGGPESVVVLREDEDHGGVFDEIPTPTPELSAFSDIVYISEEGGKTHVGTSVMVANQDGKTIVINRIGTWPALLVTNDSDTPKAIAFTAAKALQWNRADTEVNDNFVVKHPGNVTEVYSRIFLAAKESVILAYRSGTNTDVVITSDGTHLKAESMITKPVLNKNMTPIIITSPGPKGTSHLGVNILISSPEGLRPVARLATVSPGMKKKMAEGLFEDSRQILLAWPARLTLLSAPAVHRSPCTCSLEDKKATRLAEKLSGNPPHTAAERRHLTSVFICTPDGPLHRTLAPRKDSWAGVLLSGKDGELVRGHSVIVAGSEDNVESQVRFIPDSHDEMQV